MPQLCEDDVVDYMIVEALAIKANREEEKARKEQERKNWRKDTSNLRG